jgi:hypothetical protein
MSSSDEEFTIEEQLELQAAGVAPQSVSQAKPQKNFVYNKVCL